MKFNSDIALTLMSENELASIDGGSWNHFKEFKEAVIASVNKFFTDAKEDFENLDNRLEQIDKDFTNLCQNLFNAAKQDFTRLATAFRQAGHEIKQVGENIIVNNVANLVVWAAANPETAQAIAKAAGIKI
ncbi:MAG: hypothetical protein LBJ95_01975 [Oscillospiraceae bacterium]|jgi:hypothetical protein|nr:hypothetical protein [Oscillospiraceae bacterium]